MQYDKIVRISDVILHFQYSLHKLIEFVHIDIHEELACEIAEWKPYTYFPFYVKTLHYLLQKPKCISILNIFLQGTQQDAMVDIGKELPNIALEHPCRFCGIAGDFACEVSELVHGSVRPLILAAGIGIVDEETIKERV